MIMEKVCVCGGGVYLLFYVNIAVVKKRSISYTLVSKQGLSVLPKDTSVHWLQGSGTEPPTLQSVDNHSTSRVTTT